MRYDSQNKAELRISNSMSSIIESYYVNGERHRLNGPAWIMRNPETTITHEYYFVNGQLHREDGPALITRDPETGTIMYEIYYANRGLIS